jgi:hypothetical protein
MEVVTQLAVFLANKPGTLARVCEELARIGVNINAITISDTVDHAVVRLIVSDPRKALLTFEEHGTLVVENEVLMIEGSNRPGTMADIARKLAKAKINIEYAYMTNCPTSRKGLLIVRPSNVKRALEALKS